MRRLEGLVVASVVAAVTPASASARTFAQLACETRCVDTFRKCLLSGGNDVDSVGYDTCESNAVVCKFGCTGAIDPIAVSGIASLAELLGPARRMLVHGHLACETGAAWQVLGASASQHDAVAVSNSTVEGVCDGAPQPWDLVLVARGRDTFTPGDLTICADASVFDDTSAFQSRQWCVTATLAAE